MSGISQTQAFGGIVAAVVLGTWTLSICNEIKKLKRASHDERLLNEGSLTDKSSPIKSELFVLAEKVAVCGLGHVHPAALLPENRGLNRS
jgi:hypothetical protein